MNSNIQDSIWHQDLKGEWKLFFNFDIENIDNIIVKMRKIIIKFQTEIQ
jgi:hypothetical protein